MIIITGGKYSLPAVLRGVSPHLLALTLALSPATALAQTSEDSFRGTWQVETPEDGALILLLKSQGIASYFWGDNADRTVYQGSWTFAESIATATWRDDSSHLIERTESGLQITYTNAAGDRIYSSLAERIPQEILGQWAKPPTREDEMRSDRDEARGFFGIWQLADSENFLFVEPDRTTASNMGERGGQRGQWARQGRELHIVWDSGQYGILRETERGFDYKQVDPGEVIEDDETDTEVASRTIESRVASDWFTNYQAERAADPAGLAFSSLRDARAFYRGNWLVRHNERTLEQIELGRFGGLKTSKDRSLGGQWTMSGQDVFLRWDDGMRQVLSPVGRGFILYAYRPGRPLDGVPTRIQMAAPADAAKLSEHLEGRKEVAKQMREMAEAAGFDSARQRDAGWGRTFARWAWPFGDDTDALSTQELLEAEFEPGQASDPWWWPVWSEPSREESEAPQSPAEDPMDDPATEVMPESDDGIDPPLDRTEVDTGKPAEEADPVVQESEDEDTRPTRSPQRSRSTRDWLWPF